MPPKLRIGILGAARIAPAAVISPVANNSDLAEEVEIRAVAARDGERARAFAVEHGIPVVYDSYEALLADTTIDAVYNPLPNSLHCEWTVRALRAGKHVLCEKPLCNNADEAIRMQREAEGAGRVLIEAFHTVYHPASEVARGLLQAGSVGELQSIAVSTLGNYMRDPAAGVVLSYPPTSADDDVRLNSALGGGCMMDIGCYDIMAVRFLTGMEPRCTAATADVFVGDPLIDDAIEADFTFPQTGATARIRNTWASNDKPEWALPEGAPSIVIQGSRGKLEMHGFPPSKLQVNGQEVALPSVADTQTTMYWQLRAFVAEVALQEAKGAEHCGKPWAYTMKSSPTDAVAQMAVLDDVYEKAGLGKRLTTHPAPKL